MLEIVVIALLIAANGVFSLAEFAVVSARRPRVQAMLEQGRPGARAALALADDPSRFLSTVQIGITLVSLVTGAYSGASVDGKLTDALVRLGMARATAGPLGFGIVFATITYLSVVFGELVPKRFALRAPEAVACAVAPVMTLLARALTPAVWLLAASTTAMSRALRLDARPTEGVSDLEIHSVVAEAEDAGVIEPAERTMIAGVMRLGDYPVRGVMTPRADVAWLDVNADATEVRRLVTSSAHSYLPVGDGSIDAPLGVVHVRDILSAMIDGDAPNVRDHLRDAPAISDGSDALDALDVLRSAGVPVALVHDEHGHFEGIATPANMLQTIVGAFRADAHASEAGAVRRDDGAWELAGWLPVDEMAARLSLAVPSERSYTTAAGYVLANVTVLPDVGQRIEIGSWRFEILKLDGRRIDRLVAVSID